MQPVRIKALSLRKKGYSYNEINKLFGIPKSTLSSWFSNLSLSQKAQIRIRKRIESGTLNGLVERNKAQTALAQIRVRKIRRISKNEIKKFSEKDLFIIGISLYWAEGYKRVVKVNGREVTHHPISFTNSDEIMVNVFVSFLKKIMKVPSERIKLELRIFQHTNKEEAVSYWSKVSGIPKENFGKVSSIISRSSIGKRPFNRLPFGTVAVRVCDTDKFHKLMGWIDGMKKSLEYLA